jgi:hypothetical protein
VGGSIDLFRTFGFSVFKKIEIKEPLVRGFFENFYRISEPLVLVSLFIFQKQRTFSSRFLKKFKEVVVLTKEPGKNWCLPYTVSVRANSLGLTLIRDGG